jgi:polyhydroxyalkanoate synthesis regulator protein
LRGSVNRRHIGGMANQRSQQQAPRWHLIKRYSMARLYDTTTASYVDVAQLRALVRSGEDVTVLDAKTQEDITASFLRIEP